MTGFSITKTAFAGFGVIGRNPGAVLVWGVVILVLGMLPAGLMLAWMFNAMSAFATLSPEQMEARPEMMGPVLGSMMLFQPLMLIIGLAMRTVLGGAVFRAVLMPQERSWFYLRLGMRELWLALVSVVFGVLFVMAYFAMWLVLAPAVIFAGLASQDGQGGMGFLFLVPLVFAMLGVLLWLALRFSLAFPMSFAESRFRLFESWTLTRGRAGQLFLVALLLILMAWAIEIVLAVVILGGGFVALSVSGISPGELFAGSDTPPDLQALLATFWPWLAGLGVVGSFAAAALMTLFTAPWAEAYRQLATPEAQPAA